VVTPMRVAFPTYTDEEIKGAKAAIGDKTEMDVLIAYLQGMGTALKHDEASKPWTSTICVPSCHSAGVALLSWHCGWAYGKGSKKGFDEAANLPFAER
jgi:hypothetical protein